MTATALKFTKSRFGPARYCAQGVPHHYTIMKTDTDKLWSLKIFNNWTCQTVSLDWYDTKQMAVAAANAFDIVTEESK